jgi:predicted transcriptional regulator
LIIPWLVYILHHMKQLLVELDDEIAEKLERVAPGRTRQRSEFVRNALRQALWEIEERATAEAYRLKPDSGESYWSPEVWEAPKRKRSRTRRRR